MYRKAVVIIHCYPNWWCQFWLQVLVTKVEQMNVLMRLLNPLGLAAAESLRFLTMNPHSNRPADKACFYIRRRCDFLHLVKFVWIIYNTCTLPLTWLRSSNDRANQYGKKRSVWLMRLVAKAKTIYTVKELSEVNAPKSDIIIYNC